MGQPYSARAARVKIKDGAGQVVTLLASRFTIHTNSDRIDVTNFESSDDVDGLFYGDYIAGVTSAEINVEAYDSDTEGIDENDLWSVSVRAGHSNVEVKIELIENSNTFRWYFPQATVIDVSSDGEAHGALKIMLRFLNRGRWYYPGQLFNAGF